MQTNRRELLRQQVILKSLGYYTGPLDGIWGPQCIEAMRRFENRVDAFRPARPSGGMPFSADAPLPKGMWFERGLVCHGEIGVNPTSDEATALAKIPEGPVLRNRRKPSEQSQPSRIVHDGKKQNKHNRPQTIEVSEDDSDSEKADE